ncbi:hypothetical protein VMCG_01962 [Cytospora schulzeri]|uniref:Cytochrome P450 monooxygenase n=1 Tax=Cytospora schulzeri TaxID=448051 RepID=A0A423X332_9PEZI|nr:hypothetical protein VMCG_01962 [Valsa malicola]
MLILETLSSVAAYAGYIALSTTLLIIGYRIFLHPLHRYPGPFFAKLTAWYAGIFVLQQRLPQKIWRIHEKYGPVVRIAPDRLVFNTITALQDIYQSGQITKAYTYSSTNLNGVPNVFSALDIDVHRSKRKVIGQAITDRAMRTFEPIMTEQINIYLKQILEASQSSTPVNMTEKSRYLGLDIVGQLAFGYDLAVQKREDNRYIMGAMYFGSLRGNIFHHLFFLSKLYVSKFFDWAFYEVREKYWRLMENMIKSRMAEDKHAKPDLYSFVADAMSADPDSLRGGTLWSEASFFLIAGGDTVSTGISATFFYLSRNPECYRTLANEIRSTFASGSDIKAGPQLSSCTYLRACIDESLRMSPPISTTLWREQDPKSSAPLVVDGHVIPRGTLIGVNAYALHHNEEKLALDAFSAFSIGARACAGKPMAYLESSLVLARTLWYFDFEPAPGGLGAVGGGRMGARDGRVRPGEFQVHDAFTARHDGPYLVFRPRGDLVGEISASA